MSAEEDDLKNAMFTEAMELFDGMVAAKNLRFPINEHQAKLMYLHAYVKGAAAATAPKIVIQ